MPVTRATAPQLDRVERWGPACRGGGRGLGVGSPRTPVPGFLGRSYPAPPEADPAARRRGGGGEGAPHRAVCKDAGALKALHREEGSRPGSWAPEGRGGWRGPINE